MASDIPTQIRTIAVSFTDRHLIAGGAIPLNGSEIDPMLVRFSDQEDFTVFTPTSTNTAGDQRLEIGSKIICLTPTKDEMFIQTDEAIWHEFCRAAFYVFIQTSSSKLWCSIFAWNCKRRW